MPALDYERIARLYDTYCVFAGDLEYLLAAAHDAGGPVLDLMAGTGRVSLPLAAAGARVVAADSSPAMLAVLSRKSRAIQGAVQPVCADARALPFAARFALALLPFQGFTELLTEDDQRRLLAAVHGALRPGGRFVCTSHNPAVRSRSIDGSWRRVGDFAAAGSGALRVSLRAGLAEGGRVAHGQQRVEVLDAGGEPLEEIVLDLEFSLTPASRILELAAAAGFACTALQGDYSGAPFDDASSPVIIALLDKPA